LDLCNPIGIFLVRAKTSLSQSNNLLTVLEILIITDAKEVFLHMLLNTSDMLEVLKLISPTPTLPRMEAVFLGNLLL